MQQNKHGKEVRDLESVNLRALIVCRDRCHRSRKEREKGRKEGKRRRKVSSLKLEQTLAFYWDSIIHIAPLTPFFVPRLMEGRQN